ncbi:MAG: asparagine synthase (glutamine-hydrolyzing), partial [Alphaproteobacteria bacterium]
MTTSGDAPERSSLNALRAALSHRGPDGEGVHLSADVGLIQTRLAIIDLETGDQPLYDSGGGALVANGEIYNYVELRADLGVDIFSTASDCEPP